LAEKFKYGCRRCSLNLCVLRIFIKDAPFATERISVIDKSCKNSVL
jgi:hypothetical protein